MAEALNVEVREPQGKRAARRLRSGGAIPGILYGHGEANVSLAVPKLQISTAVRRGSRVVELKGAVNEKAFIRDLQWDVYGVDILHVDFARVSEHERITLQVAVELRGQAPGVKAGGVVELSVHELEIECEALRIPEKLEVSINELELDGAITAGQVKLPPGVTLVSDPDVVIVHCVQPVDHEEALGGEGGGAEPEVIGRKPDEETEE
jgi:large subunit ribosomal protein L25